MCSEKITYAREITVRYDCDVLVAGGGMAGVCAACAAADRGAKVILVERFGMLGGNATIAGVGAFCGNTMGQGKIFDEIVRELEDYHAIAPHRVNENYAAREFRPEMLAIVLQEMILKRKIKVLLQTRLIDAIVESGCIRYVVISGKSGNEAISAKQFIDCTGDGDLAFFAGCEMLSADPVKKLPMSLMYFVRHMQSEEMDAFKIPEDRFDDIGTEDELPMTSVWKNGPRSNAIKIKIPSCDAASTEGITQAEIRSKRRMMQVTHFHQYTENKNWMIDHLPAQIGIREGRRILGDYVLQVDDLYQGRKFNDGVAVGTFYLDAHKPDDDKRTYILPEEKRHNPPYQIPFRALVAKDCINLMMAGRCMSADQLALSSARVMTTCAMMGQAVGIAAAECVKAGSEIRQMDIAKLYEILIQNNAELNPEKYLKI